MRFFFILLSLLISITVCAADGAPKSVLLRQGNYQVKQLVSPGFDQLPLKRKLFALEMSQAIEAGHEIVWIQNNEFGLEIRDFMHALWKHSSLFSPTQKAGLAEYLFLLEANHGNYDERKNKKFVPEQLTYEQVYGMAVRVDQALGSRSLEDRLELLKSEIFAMDHKPALHADGPDDDIVRDSAANYYGPAITKADIEALPKEIGEHFLSYPYRDFDGKIKMKLHKIGERFGKYLALVDDHFVRAMEYATPEERSIISAYRVALYSGNPRDLALADGMWAEHKPTDIDFVANFVEDYGDPLNKRGEWEGFLILLNQTPEDRARVENIRKNAAYFESRMPVDEEFKKKGDFTPPKAEGAYLLFAAGANGEKPFAGVNLPNSTIDPRINEKHGSKSYTADNVMTDIGSENEKYSSDKLAMFYAPEYQELLERVDTPLVRKIQVEFHEILGHGSGRMLDGVTTGMLGEYSTAMEEGRAEVASLYHMLDGKIRDFGIVPKEYTDAQLHDFQTAAIVTFFSDHLRTYERLTPTTERIRQAHQWGRQVMLARLLQAGAFHIETQGEHAVPVIKAVDLTKARQALGALWRDLQKGKSTGDLALIKEMFETDGAYPPQYRGYRLAIVGALEALNVPREQAYLNPRFEVVQDADGNATDVRLVYEQAGAVPFERFVDRQVERADQARERLACAGLLR